MTTALAGLKPVPTLATRSRAGFGWNIAGGTVRAVAGFAVNSVLARLLGPEPFGQVALVLAVVGLGHLLVEAGLGVALVQKPVIGDLDIRYAFTMQLAAGVGLGLLIALFAPAIAVAFSQPEVGPLLGVMACILPIQAYGQTGSALLRRGLEFQRLQTLQVGSYLAGYLTVGIPLAISGYGVWSLVLAQLTQACVLSAGAWLISGHSIRPYWGGGNQASSKFLISITTGNVAAWAVSALPALLLGKFQGVAALGLYSRAFFVVSSPATVIAASLQSMTLALHSRLAKHRRVSNRACLRIMASCLFVTAPAFLAVAAMSSTVIEALFGGAWAAAAALLTPLAIAMPLECLAALSGPLLIARGRPALEFWVQAATAISTLLIVGLVASQQSMAATAWAVLFGVYLVRAIAASAGTLRSTGISAFQWAAALAPGAFLGAFVFLLVLFMEGWLVDAGVGAWPRLLTLASLAGAVSGTAAFAAPKSILWK